MESIFEYAKKREQLLSNIKIMIVEQLGLEFEPEFISNDQPIFGRGLELDSIDALELAIGMFERFDVSVTDDNTSVFESVNTIADFIENETRKKGDNNEIINTRDYADASSSISVSFD